MRILSVFLLVLAVAVCHTAAGRLGVQHKWHWWQQFEKNGGDMMAGSPSYHGGMEAHMPVGASAWERERFVLDILLQVHKPLMNEGFVSWAQQYHGDASMYNEPHDPWLLWFLSHAKAHDFVGPQHTFDAWKLEHAQFVMGFYKFLVLAHDWEMFAHNVCFGRMHLNPVVFVNGLYFAMRDREDTHDIVLPAMYEVLPGMFFDDDVLKMAEETEWPHLVGYTQTQKPKLWDMLGMHGGWHNGGGMASIPPMSTMHQPKWWNSWQRWNSDKPYMSMPPPTYDYTNPMDMPMESHMSDEHKLIIHVGSDEHPMLFTDDIGMNVFWQHMMMERLMQKMSAMPQDSMEMHSMKEMHSMYMPPTIVMSMKEPKMPDWWMQGQGSDSYGENHMPMMKSMPSKHSYTKHVDALPTANVDSDRLVHVSRRWRKPYMASSTSNSSPPHYWWHKMGGEYSEHHDTHDDDKWRMYKRSHPVDRMDDHPNWWWNTKESSKVMPEHFMPHWTPEDHTPHWMSEHDNEHHHHNHNEKREYEHNHMMTAEMRDARSGEIFMHNLQQMVARIHFDKVAMPTWWTWPQQSTYAILHSAVEKAVAEFKHIVDMAHEEDMMHVIADLLMGRNPKYPHAWEMMHEHVWHAMQEVMGMSAHFSTVANLHEPVEQMLLEELVHLFAYYESHLPPHTADHWSMSDVHVHDAHFEPMVTYTEYHDAVLVNMVDQQLLQSHSNNMEYVQQSVMARQQRLNHQPFDMAFKVSADHSQHVVFRVMMAPKIDHMGHKMTLADSRHHFVVLDAFEYMLQPGMNMVHRHAHNITWTTRDFTPLTELYKNLFTDKSWHHDEFVGCNCHYPHHMLLPRGTKAGMPVQIFIMVTPVDQSMAGWHIDVNEICGMGISSLMWDHLPFNFPFDRPINSEKLFDASNVFMMDSMIYHHDNPTGY